MKHWCKRALFLLLITAAVPVRADVAYVSEGSSVGVHENDALTSTILTLLSPGTALEVLEEKNGLAHVRLRDGVEGWVDARYLTRSLTPGQKLSGLEEELTQTATELAKARDQVAELTFQLNREKERTSVLESELLSARKAAENPAPEAGAADARKLRDAVEENRELRKRIARLEARTSENGSDDNPGAHNPYDNPGHGGGWMSHYTAISRWEFWQIMLLFFSLLLAFSVGGYVVDWEVRRRHGGFRV